MALSYKARRRWALVILLVGLPLYIIAVSVVIAQFERPGVLLQLLIFVALGIVWILPFKSVFKGIGQADPDAKD